VVHPAGRPPTDSAGLESSPLTVDLVRAGEPVGDPGLDAARRLVAAGLGSLPWDGLKLSRGEPAIPTRMA
jgi:nicotinate phosphoribosyltransferase